MNTTTYETGATSHAVNDLILFTDNTRSVAEYRDKTYEQMIGGMDADLMLDLLLDVAIKEYKREFPSFFDHQHIENTSVKYGVHFGKFTKEMREEYKKLYLDDFPNWKSEHGYK